MALSPEDLRIRALRPSRPARREIDPWRPFGVTIERERRPGGEVESAATVFLAGAECPFTCAFCDLWSYTLEAGPTPPGALPAQLRAALAEVPAAGPAAVARLKLYNASNFFDPRAVPVADLPAIAALAAPFAGVTVECHPRLVGPKAEEFARRIPGKLEVAVGLETVHPGALAALNKKATVEDFDRAAERLAGLGIGLRVFVLVGAPYVPVGEREGWVGRTVAHALARGADAVSLIPVRGGNGELERLAAEGAWEAPALGDLERALEVGLEAEKREGRGVVAADLWDAEALAVCAECGPARLERLARMNLSGRFEPPVACGACSGGR